MIITKFSHSCVLIEHNGNRLLIDPGMLSFPEGGIKPEEIGPVDAILLTHSHPDHFHPETLKKIPTKTIITHAELRDLLERENLQAELIAAGETKETAGFTIDALEAPHGALPLGVPYSLAYLINKTILHPGDSYAQTSVSPKVLLLPIFSPWGTLNNAVEYAQKIKANITVPIHEMLYIDFMKQRMFDVVEKKLAEDNIAFKVLHPKETIDTESI